MRRAIGFPGKILPAVLAAIFLIGCAHEKTTDYRRADYTSRKPLKSVHMSGRDLADTDVLGASALTPSEEDIRNALDRAAKVHLKEGENVLVVQSGEVVPDSRMVAELNKHYRAIPFSGIRGDWIKGNSVKE